MGEPTKTTANPVRASTVVWGVVIVIVAAAAYAISFIDMDFGMPAVTPQMVILVVVGIGALLVTVAVVGAIMRSFRRRHPPIG
jgi:4-amino-4-deoxy-L-arabinose transferase-like glycosyltransferase